MSLKCATHSLCLAAVLSLSVGILSSPASATPTLDQFESPGFGATGFSSTLERAQVFTSGLNGLLSQVVVVIQKPSGSTDDLTFGIHNTTGGVPYESAFYTGTVSSAAVPTTFGAVAIDLSSAGIYAHPGVQLAISLSNTSASGSSGWFWRSSAGTPPYPDGGFFLRGAPGYTTWGEPDPNLDGTFYTYVDTALTPEPTTALLLASGLVGLAARRRVTRA